MYTCHVTMTLNYDVVEVRCLCSEQHTDCVAEFFHIIAKAVSGFKEGPTKVLSYQVSLLHNVCLLVGNGL